MLDLLGRFWEFLGSPQFGPIVTLAQLTLVPIIYLIFRRVGIVYSNIMAIPEMRTDIQRLFTATNTLKRDVRRIEQATSQRHTENLAAMRGGPAQ